ncbi:MAG: aminotransferase class I/II-fold pyridoxal phosphate-dependent enzyme, partial [Planctomycetes bacterium]|nr:aminotransferase class I/II-fold pyridoxal phosphate-dependent enzyme [Planctomycetota bacterium]
MRGLCPSATLEINRISDRLISEGRTIHKLGLGQSPFPVPDCVVEALRHNAHQKTYLDVQGLRELREAVAAFHRKSDGVSVDPDGVLVGPGSKELMFLLQVAFYGDLVVPTPCWVSYIPQAQILGHHVSLLPGRFEGRWQVSAEALESLCATDPGRPRLVVLNYPGNPDGLTYAAGELEAIAAVARKFGLILLSDEIYGKLHHRGEHVSVARFYPEGTIVSSGLSKWCGAGGWRLGTFSFPGPLRWLLEAMSCLASETYTSTSSPIQYAAVRAFQGGEEIETYLAHVRRILAALGRWCADRLRRAGARVHDPEGAFYLFPDFGLLAGGLARAG